MNVQETDALLARYDQRFGNLDEVLLPALLGAADYLNLFRTALERGQAVTREAIDAVIPDAPWDF